MAKTKVGTKEIIVRLVFDKKTPGTIRMKAADDEGGVKTVYIQKANFKTAGFEEGEDLELVIRKKGAE